MIKKVALLGLLMLVISALSTSLATAESQAGCKAKCLKGLIDDLEDRLDDQEETIEDLEDELEDLSDDLEAANSYVDYFDECLWVTPMSQYGDAETGEHGYFYGLNGGSSSFLTTGLDYTTTGDFVHSWVFYDNCEDYNTPLSSQRAMKVGKPLDRSR